MSYLPVDGFLFFFLQEHKYYVLESNTDLSSEEYQQLEDATVGNASILVETLTKGPATDELDAGLDAYTQVLQNGRVSVNKVW